MNIQNIKIIDRDTIVITNNNGDEYLFKKDELKGPERAWFENIMACSLSLINYNPPK